MEAAVLTHNDDTLIGSGGNNEQTAVGVNGNGDGLVDSAFVEEVADRLGNDLDVVTVAVKQHDSVIVGVADVDVLVVYKHAGGIGQSIANTLGVYKGLDLKLELVVTVQTDDAGILRVNQIHVLIGVNEEVTGIIKRGTQTHVGRVDYHVRHIRLGRIQNESGGGVGVGCVRSGSTDDTGEHHGEDHYGKQNS